MPDALAATGEIAFVGADQYPDCIPVQTAPENKGGLLILTNVEKIGFLLAFSF